VRKRGKIGLFPHHPGAADNGRVGLGEWFEKEVAGSTGSPQQFSVVEPGLPHEPHEKSSTRLSLWRFHFGDCADPAPGVIWRRSRSGAATDWPGNIRELENFIERTVIITRGKSLEAPLGTVRELSTAEATAPKSSSPQPDIARIVKETLDAPSGNNHKQSAVAEHAQKQREETARALSESKGRVGGTGGAAARIGINCTTLCLG
jgi:hypothetical protein